MIWLIVGAPLFLMIGISLYFGKKTNAAPPDVNKGNHNIEAETTRVNFYNTGG